jgi:cell wall-associated NlpC family hydrolase
MKLLARALGALLFAGLSVGLIAPATAHAVEPQAPALAQSVTLASSSNGSDDIENMLRDTIIATAKSLVGKYPYVWGGGHGTKPGPSCSGKDCDKGFDCSGYVRYVLYVAGFGDFALTAEGFREKANDKGSWLRSISKSNLKPGDLIIYGPKSKANHIAIYAGTKGGKSYVYEAWDGIQHNAFHRSDVLMYVTLF